MATKIRLKRFGGKHDPHYRIVVADSRKQRDGRAVEELGYYCPIGDPSVLQVNAERALHWLQIGAQPTDTVRSLLVRAGVIAGAEETEAAPTAASAEEAAEAPEEAAEAGEAPEEAAATSEPAEEAAATGEAPEEAAATGEPTEEAAAAGETQ